MTEEPLFRARGQTRLMVRFINPSRRPTDEADGRRRLRRTGLSRLATTDAPRKSPPATSAPPKAHLSQISNVDRQRAGTRPAAMREILSYPQNDKSQRKTNQFAHAPNRRTCIRRKIPISFGCRRRFRRWGGGFERVLARQTTQGLAATLQHWLFRLITDRCSNYVQEPPHSGPRLPRQETAIDRYDNP